MFSMGFLSQVYVLKTESSAGSTSLKTVELQEVKKKMKEVGNWDRP